MNARREFLKNILLASVAPSVIIPKFADHNRWVEKTESDLWLLNDGLTSEEWEKVIVIEREQRRRLHPFRWRHADPKSSPRFLIAPFKV